MHRLTPTLGRCFGSSAAAQSKVPTVVIGCGAPNKGMGWYHSEQLLNNRCPSLKLSAVVEPWFLSKDNVSSPASKPFNDWKASLPSSVSFHASPATVPKQTSPSLAIISCRTADTPPLLSSALSMGVSAIYLEKPGAPSVSQLESMAASASAAQVPVVMGYNKGVARYVSSCMQYLSSCGRDDVRVTFGHNNNYSDDERSLGECFERNSEGMLKNMAIHEIALLVAYFGVRADNISKVHACKKFSKALTLTGPSSGLPFTDFQRVKFTVVTTAGRRATVVADRCGGAGSYATAEAPGSVELFRAEQPDGLDEGAVAELRSKYPEAMSYFLGQDADYVTLKEGAAAVAKGGTLPKGMLGIKEAVEVLKVAEYLTPILLEQLKGAK